MSKLTLSPDGEKKNKKTGIGLQGSRSQPIPEIQPACRRLYCKYKPIIPNFPNI